MLKGGPNQQLYASIQAKVEASMKQMAEVSNGYASHKRKYDSRTVAKFITQVSREGKGAYEAFREQAIESGLYKKSPEPLPRIHKQYYDKYIRFKHATPMPSERAMYDRSVS